MTQAENEIALRVALEMTHPEAAPTPEEGK
jgi:hypothetical protein